MIAAKLQAILSAKGDIKAAIESKGVTVGNASLDQYASKIGEIASAGDVDGMNGFLSVESKTIATSASATTNITYNKNCGILDENYKKWDTLAWHQRWVDNGYSATGLSKPIGIWMKAFGLDLVYLWLLKNSKVYYEISGTNILPQSGFTHLPNGFNVISSATEADRTIWPANQSGMIAHGTAGKYKSATWRAVNNGNGLDMVCDNTMETFTIPSRDIGHTHVFMKTNCDDRMEGLYQHCEFFRALFAICSGISTTQSNGTITTVEILNASGQQASVNEDMYFYIGGTNTGLKAKYNLNCLPKAGANVTTGSLTQAITDAIYAKQIAAGINMNDTGVNSINKPILVDGAKGAEAVAVDGYWYIKTPFVTVPSTNYAVGNNMMDARSIYACKHKGFVIQTERQLYPYWLNSTTHIVSIANLLSNKEGFSGILLPSDILWSICTYNGTYSMAVNPAYGYIQSQTTNYRYQVLPTLPSNTQYTT